MLVCEFNSVRGNTMYRICYMPYVIGYMLQRICHTYVRCTMCFVRCRVYSMLYSSCSILYTRCVMPCTTPCLYTCVYVHMFVRSSGAGDTLTLSPPPGLRHEDDPQHVPKAAVATTSAASGGAMPTWSGHGPRLPSLLAGGAKSFRSMLSHKHDAPRASVVEAVRD